MLMPSIFGDNLFDDFMNDFPFFDDRDMKKMEKKLYGRHGKNLMKTDIRETEDSYELETKAKTACVFCRIKTKKENST